MVTMTHTPPHPVAATVNNEETNSTPNLSSDYEKCREQRIKENLERMQKLGIYDLSLKMKSVKPNRYRKNNKPLSTDQNKTPNSCVPPLPSSVPTRRSSRLQSTPAVSYAEVDVPKKGKACDDIWLEKTSRPEVYTEEHEKLLGEAKTEWTLFVDGYGKDGKRIYDQVRGKTCHQCRQKTLGHRTHCIECNLVQGQFCGDCLYMRYGENVLEAMQNPDWICPVCRGICNCSLCRQAKGWAATGALYRKISRQGYKSVAHYLIQTFRADPNLEKERDTQVSAKRSLPFSREELESEDIAAKNENIEKNHKNQEGEVNTDDKPTELQPLDEAFCDNAKLESDQGLEESNVKAEVNVGGSENKNKDIESEVQLELELTNVENKVNNTDEEVKTVVILTPESKSGSRKKRGFVALENIIAGRLRSRRACLQPSDEPLCDNVNLESDQGLEEGNFKEEINEGEHKNKDKIIESEVELELANVENKVNNTDDEVKAVILTPVTKPGSRKRRAFVALEDSIGGRLRSRRSCT